MPTNRKKRSRHLQASGGLSEVAYQYFGSGPFFEAEYFEAQTTPEERADIWKEHRAAIIARWRLENPANLDLGTWGEHLEGAADAD
jgi:hypothetical protein